jgi:hypothetical protein
MMEAKEVTKQYKRGHGTQPVKPHDLARRVVLSPRFQFSRRMASSIAAVIIPVLLLIPGLAALFKRFTK